MCLLSASAPRERSFLSAERGRFEKSVMNPSKSFKILYVETNEDDRLLLETALGRPFVEITLVKTATEALKLSASESFDLILLETRFPDGSGFDLCRKILSLNPHAPIIFYSGDASEKDKKTGLAAGAKAYLAKPHFDQLTTTVKQFIG
jgi:CheY-like chemotaxis protein